MRVKIKHAGDLCVAATADTQRLQTGVQSTLLIIEQAHEQDDGGAHFMGQHVGFLSTGPGVSVHAQAVLFLLCGQRSREIYELSIDYFPMNAILPDQSQHRFFDLAADNPAQFRKSVAFLCQGYECLSSTDQGPILGESGIAMPQ
jgi:hypothetical protein